MKKNLTKKYLLLLICIMFNQILIAQVKTRIYEYGIPANKIATKSLVASEIIFKAPNEFDNFLKNSKSKQVNKNSEYDNKFATPKMVNLNFIKESKLIEIDNELYYLLNITAENAINISLQFKDFHLSKNSILSIFNENELTDSITNKENNEKNLWATRVYQGAKLSILLKTPISEKGLSNFKISQVSFGYKKFGGEFFGTPGASAACNINVICPQGNTWQNERNAVAIMLVADGAGTCTGSLINNTCSVNTPYVLTANHCLSGNLNNWVFQYQYFSTTCTSNTGGREDIQFNGCSLKASSANTDFALVQMNQTPTTSSGVAYAGWNRSATPAINTVEIHHPASDLMKISLDANPPLAISWPGISDLTHWRARFQQGTVQPGSSGSPLFDQNNRIIGQCHGDQNNAGNYCAQRISECGRFDLSWTGGGTNTSRLSNWLDPTNTGAMTTNTTNIINLATPTASLSISGDISVCTTSSPYFIPNLPTGSSVTWSVNPTDKVIVNTPNNLTTTLTKINDGSFILIATVINCEGSTVISKTFFVGQPYFGVTYKDGITDFKPVSIYTQNPNVSNTVCIGYNNPNVYLNESPVGAYNITWSVIDPEPQPNFRIEGQSGNKLYFNWRFGGLNPIGYLKGNITNTCGSFEQTFSFQQVNCGTTGPGGNPCTQAKGTNFYSISPNPAKENITISVSTRHAPIQCSRYSAITTDKGIIFSVVNVYEKLGTLKKSYKTSNAKQASVQISDLIAGSYVVEIIQNDYVERQQIIIQK